MRSTCLETLRRASSAPLSTKSLGLILLWLACLGCPGISLFPSPGGGIALAAQPPVAARSEKRVVILFSMPLDFPATQMAEQGLREALAEKAPFSLQIFSEYLDLSRFRHETQRQALADLLRHRYGAAPVDLVIAVDVPATHFLIDRAEEVFPGVPVVVCDIPEPYKPDILAASFGGRVSGVLEPLELARQLVASALRLRPESRHAVLISGAFENDVVRAALLRQAIAALQPRVELIDLGGLSLGDILDRCQSLPADSLIFFSTLFVDARGRFFVPRDVILSLSHYAGSPIWASTTPTSAAASSEDRWSACGCRGSRRAGSPCACSPASRRAKSRSTTGWTRRSRSTTGGSSTASSSTKTCCRPTP